MREDANGREFMILNGLNRPAAGGWNLSEVLRRRGGNSLSQTYFVETWRRVATPIVDFVSIRAIRVFPVPIRVYPCPSVVGLTKPFV